MMHAFPPIATACLLLTVGGVAGGQETKPEAKSSAPAASPNGAAPKVRSFQFEYGATLTKLPAGKPFAIALTMMLVLTLIGLVLGVLIPRQPIEATAAADSVFRRCTRRSPTIRRSAWNSR